MFKTKPNERTITVKLTRHEVLDLMLMCTAHDGDAKKWGEIYDKLCEQVENWDKKNLDKEEVKQ